MWPFKKKKIYKVKWCHTYDPNFITIEFIKAYDVADAYKRISSKCLMTVSLIEVEEIKE